MTNEPEDEEALSCEGCHSERKVEIYKDAHVQGNTKRDVALCEVCSWTNAGNVLALCPRIHEGQEVIRVVAQVANIILDRIDGLEERLDQDPLP